MARKAPGITQHFKCKVCGKTYTHIGDIRIQSVQCPTEPHRYQGGKGKVYPDGGLLWMEEVTGPAKGVRYVPRRSSIS